MPLSAIISALLQELPPLLAVIGRVEDFESEDKLASYFGIVPRVSNSNETLQHGRITKRGFEAGPHNFSAMHFSGAWIVSVSPIS